MPLDISIFNYFVWKLVMELKFYVFHLLFDLPLKVISI
jgi:hypothetical protein